MTAEIIERPVTTEADVQSAPAEFWDAQTTQMVQDALTRAAKGEADEATRAVLDHISAGVERTETMTGGFTIPDTDEWIPGGSVVTYGFTTTDEQGETRKHNTPTGLAEQLYNYGQDRAAGEQPTGHPVETKLAPVSEGEAAEAEEDPEEAVLNAAYDEKRAELEQEPVMREWVTKEFRGRVTPGLSDVNKESLLEAVKEEYGRYVEDEAVAASEAAVEALRTKQVGDMTEVATISAPEMPVDAPRPAPPKGDAGATSAGKTSEVKDEPIANPNPIKHAELATDETAETAETGQTLVPKTSESQEPTEYSKSATDEPEIKSSTAGQEREEAAAAEMREILAASQARRARDIKSRPTGREVKDIVSELAKEKKPIWKIDAEEQAQRDQEDQRSQPESRFSRLRHGIGRVALGSRDIDRYALDLARRTDRKVAQAAKSSVRFYASGVAPAATAVMGADPRIFERPDPDTDEQGQRIALRKGR